MAGLITNLKSLPIPGDALVHVHRPDDLLPFVLSGVGRAWVCTLHGNPLQAIRERASRAAYAAYSATEAWVLRRAHRVIFVDSGNASTYLRRYPWLRGRYDVIPNAVDMDLFRAADKREARRRWGVSGTVFLYAGRLQPEKRVPEIIHAFRALGRSDALLVVAGEGRDASEVEQAAEGLRVKKLGPVSRTEMPSLMSAADALLMFSTREGLPSVVLEALACGLPVITTPVGALPQVVIDEKAGTFVSTRNELTEAMERVCRGAFADAPSIRQTVVRYSWSELGPKTVEAYSSAEQAAGEVRRRRH